MRSTWRRARSPPMAVMRMALRVVKEPAGTYCDDCGRLGQQANWNVAAPSALMTLLVFTFRGALLSSAVWPPPRQVALRHLLGPHPPATARPGLHKPGRAAQDFALKLGRQVDVILPGRSWIGQDGSGTVAAEVTAA